MLFSFYLLAPRSYPMTFVKAQMLSFQLASKLSHCYKILVDITALILNCNCLGSSLKTVSARVPFIKNLCGAGQLLLSPNEILFYQNKDQLANANYISNPFSVQFWPKS